MTLLWVSVYLLAGLLVDLMATSQDPGIELPGRVVLIFFWPLMVTAAIIYVIRK